jgi:hypothetical protein
MNNLKFSTSSRFLAGLVCAAFVPSTVLADQVILDDLIVDGSACIGFDCVNGESFGFDTIRMKENNVRIGVNDTSNSASFPNNDWQITFNDSSNGGLNKFSIDDISNGLTPFTIEARALSHSLYVDDGGRIGFGTSTPAVDLHVKSGNTPTLRLEQDGTSGFSAQTWDVAGNETSFFIRDASNGSTLPFRIFPSAPSSALTIEGTTGDIGLGTNSPLGALHIENTGGEDVDDFVVTADGKVGIGNAEPLDDLHVSDAGAARLRLTNTTKAVTATEDPDWIINSNGTLRISADSTGSAEFELDAGGNLTLMGSLTTAGGMTPDYVFQPGYELMSLKDLSQHITLNQHLPNIPSAAEIQEKGSVNISKMQMRLLEKIEELTLYTISQQQTIESLGQRLAKLEK